MAAGRLQVYAKAWEQPLLDTSDASHLVFRDRFGDAHTLFYRVLSDEVWAMVTVGDAEWADKAKEFGL